MQEWGWVIASVILLVTLVQLLAYYYIVRGGGPSILPSSTDGKGNANTPPGAVSRGEALGRFEDADGDPGPADEDVRRCTECGAPNDSDPVYTFCHNCGSQL